MRSNRQRNNRDDYETYDLWIKMHASKTQLLHVYSSLVVVMNDAVGDTFITRGGLKQGCLLSPHFLNGDRINENRNGK